MKIDIDGLQVYFPFKNIYPEQLDYMTRLKKVFDSLSQNSLIQIPPAISKPTCLFSVYFSYFMLYPEKLPKLVYSVATTFEVNHTASIAKFVFENIQKELDIVPEMLVLSVAEKKNLCIHETASKNGTREAVENECIKRIAPWVRNPPSKKKDHTPNGANTHDGESLLCSFYEGYLKYNLKELKGCFSLEELKSFGAKNTVCPYYLSEDLFSRAQVIICNYFFLASSKRSIFFDQKGIEGAILYVDECCGLDEELCEVYTERISRISLDFSMKSIEDLNQKLKHIQSHESKRYEEEYQKLVRGLTKNDLDLNKINKNETIEITEETPLIKFPGYIRKPQHFITHMKKFIVFLKNCKKHFNKKVISHSNFLDKYLQDTLIDPNMLPLAYFPTRLKALLNFLHIPDSEAYLSLYSLVHFACLFGSFSEGFEVIFDSIQDTVVDIKEASKELVSLVCLDPKNPFAELTANFSCIIMNTETLKDTELFANIIGLSHDHPNEKPLSLESVPLVDKLKVFPLIVTKGADQIELSTEFIKKHDAGVMRNYANMIISLAEALPDGILCLFPSFKYLKDIGLDYYDEILEKKLIFAETVDVNDTIKSVVGYKKACENGRGAVFLGLLKGNVIGKVPFEASESKCIIIYGIPLDYSRPREFLARVKYFKLNKGIPENEYIIYSSMKEVNKALGNIIRRKEDSCIVIFADRRFMQQDKIARLPEFILKNLDEASKGIPSDQVQSRATRFIKVAELDKEWTKYGEEQIQKLMGNLSIHK